MHRAKGDEELVRASLAGELRAFEALVHRYQSPVYWMIVGYVREGEAARDLAQETFLRAFQELESLGEPGKFGAWLRGIARNRCLNALRAQQRAGRAQDQLAHQLAGSAGTPVGEGDAGLVDGLLAHLPARSARAFAMHYVEGIPVSAIAQQLACSPQSVKQRLYRARQRLQKEVMSMMKDPSGKEQLPEGLASQVIAGLLEAGRQDRLYMRYDRARERFQEAVDAAPDNPEALLELGSTYDIMMDWPTRVDVEVLERAAVVAPESLAVMGALERAYRQPEYAPVHEEVFRKCLDLCDQRLAEVPGDVRALKSKAGLLRGAADYAGAEELLRRAVDIAPEDQEAHFFLARNLDHQERREEAMPLYEKTCELDPETIWAYGARRNLSTHLAFRTGDIGRAVALMEEVWELTRKPNEAGNLIYFYSATGQLQEAITVFEQVEDHRHHPRVLVVVGIADFECGNFQRAAKVLKAAVATTGDAGLAAEAQLHRTRALFALDEAEEARQVLEEGLKLDLNARAALAGAESSVFWRPWTRWLARTLEDLAPQDGRAAGLLQAVQQALAQ